MILIELATPTHAGRLTWLAKKNCTKNLLDQLNTEMATDDIHIATSIALYVKSNKQ